MRLAAHVALGFRRPHHRVLGMVFAGRVVSRGARTALAPGGEFLSVDSGAPRLRAEDLEYLLGMAARGEIAPAIDRTYSLDQAADAHRYVETRHKCGNVLLRISRD